MFFVHCHNLDSTGLGELALGAPTPLCRRDAIRISKCGDEMRRRGKGAVRGDLPNRHRSCAQKARSEIEPDAFCIGGRRDARCAPKGPNESADAEPRLAGDFGEQMILPRLASQQIDDARESTGMQPAVIMPDRCTAV